MDLAKESVITEVHIYADENGVSLRDSDILGLNSKSVRPDTLTVFADEDVIMDLEWENIKLE